MKVRYSYTGRVKDGAEVLGRNWTVDGWHIRCACGAEFAKRHRAVQWAFKGHAILRCDKCYRNAQRAVALAQTLRED